MAESNDSLRNQTAVVTGSSSGIGRAIALELGGMGAVVIGTATSVAGATEIQKTLDTAGSAGLGVVLNVTDAAAREALGYEPSIDFDEGLRRSIEYYRSLM